MTCIAAVIDTERNKVVMGGDSLASNGWDSTKRRDPKVFRKGEMLIGFTTSYRMGQLLRYKLVIPEHDPAKDAFEYMVVDFVEAARECFRVGGYMGKEDERDEGGNFLVGWRGRLFNIDADFQVGEAASGYDAIGCGASYAKGSLYTTRTDSDPYHRVHEALSAACEHSNGCGAPATIEEVSLNQG